jgi:hypothetical protein
MVRVLRPGGRICITDTDWRTMLIDHPSSELLRTFTDAVTTLRGDQMTVGARLVNMLRNGDVAGVEAAAETHMWLRWDPDTSMAPPGMVPLSVITGGLVAQGLLEAEPAQRLLVEFEQTARADRFFVSLTMFAAAGTKLA